MTGNEWYGGGVWTASTNAKATIVISSQKPSDDLLWDHVPQGPLTRWQYTAWEKGLRRTGNLIGSLRYWMWRASQ